MADQTAQYIFMHKDIPVAEFGLDSVTGTIVSIGQVYEPRHVPVGIPDSTRFDVTEDRAYSGEVQA